MATISSHTPVSSRLSTEGTEKNPHHRIELKIRRADQSKDVEIEWGAQQLDKSAADPNAKLIVKGGKGLPRPSVESETIDGIKYDVLKLTYEIRINQQTGDTYIVAPGTDPGP